MYQKRIAESELPPIEMSGLLATKVIKELEEK